MKSPILEIEINNEKVCVAGISNEFGLLSANVLWVSRKIDNSGGLRFDVNGNDAVEGCSHTWFSEGLNIGDIIKISISEDSKITKSEIKMNNFSEEKALEEKLKLYHRLKNELKDYL